MTVRYLVNDILIFDPTHHTLTAAHNSGRTVTLNVPVSRCFNLLLENRYAIVHQKNFFLYVWGSAGDEVSTNTLYQNIALLRRALKLFDLKGNFYVITVPRKGFSLSEQVTVRELGSEYRYDTDPSDAEENDPDLAPEVFRENIANVSVVKHGKGSPVLLPVATVTLVLLTAVLCLQFFYWGGTPMKVNNQYGGAVTFLGGCRFFSGKEKVPLQVLEELNSEHYLNCKDHPYVYLRTFSQSAHLSYFACRKPLNSFSYPECISSSVYRVSTNEK